MKRGHGLGLGLLGVLLVAGVSGVVPRLRARAALDQTQAAARSPRLLRVAAATQGAARREVTLPGTSAPFQVTTLYARSTGYLRRNLVDVGDRVKAGQLLAEIDAPETDEDLRLAQAQLDEAEANVGLVQRTAERSRALSGEGVVSQQQVDDTRAQANSAEATLRTRRAAVQRLNALRGYQRVLAPFDGIVTRRGVDRGALIGAATGGGVALFEIAQVDRLRVFVDVPQSLARDVRVGGEVWVYAPADPQHAAAGKVARTSGVLDAGTRTLHTEIHLPGTPDGPVLPGAFVYVRFVVSQRTPPVVVPANALIVRKEGTQVGKVEAGVVHLVNVQIGRDLGKELELVSGVKPGDQVVLNPPDELADGTPVRVAASAPPG